MPIVENIRQFNERVEFLVKQPNPGPEPGEVSTSLFSCWAYVRTRNISDVRESFGTFLEDTIDFVVRYDQPEEITNKMSIKWKKAEYEIIKVNPDTGQKKYTVIIAKKVA